MLEPSLRFEDSKPQSLSASHPPPPHASCWLSHHVTSLRLVPEYSPILQNNWLCARGLLLAKSHLSTFTNLEFLTLTTISLIDFDAASIEAFASLAGTVLRLKLWMCSFDERMFFAFVRLFTRLESLELRGNVWLGDNPAGKAEALERVSPALRGSLTASEFVDGGLLRSLAAAKIEYHTIILGWNFPSAAPHFNALFVKCGTHLKTLYLTPPEWHPNSGYPSHTCRSSFHVRCPHSG